MSAIERITKAAHLIDMKDIIREGNPTLRAVAEEVSFPLSDQDIILGEKIWNNVVEKEKKVLFYMLLDILFDFSGTISSGTIALLLWSC